MSMAVVVVSLPFDLELTVVWGKGDISSAHLHTENNNVNFFKKTLSIQIKASDETKTVTY